MCGRKVVGPRPIKAARGGNAVNKAGRLVIRGRAEGRLIKIYEAANPCHAEFIAAACNHSRIADCFPAVRVGCGRFLVADWSEDISPSGPPVEVLVELMNRVHRTPPAELPEAGFDYWHDYIKPRFVRAAELLDYESAARDVVTIATRAWDRHPRYVVHPDLTPRNVVLNSARLWQIIDNELLSVGGMPLLDACNTAFSLGTAGQAFVDDYLAPGAITVDNDDIAAVNAAWLARQTGSAFVAGDVIGAKRLIDRYQAGELVLPANLTANAPLES